MKKIILMAMALGLIGCAGTPPVWKQELNILHRNFATYSDADIKHNGMPNISQMIADANGGICPIIE